MKLLRLPMSVPLKGYRTLIASGLTVAFGVLATADWVSILNSPKDGIWTIGIGLMFAILRLYTSTPAGDSEHPAEVKVEEVEKVIKANEPVEVKLEKVANTVAK